MAVVTSTSECLYLRIVEIGHAMQLNCTIIWIWPCCLED